VILSPLQIIFGFLPKPVSHSDFRIDISSDKKQPVTITVLDASGRIIEKRQSEEPSSPIYLGDRLIPGIYFGEIRQDNQRKTIKLIKL
jgi:hypothetical protein